MVHSAAQNLLLAKPGDSDVSYARCYFCDAQILPDDATITVARLYLTVHLACYERDLAATLITSKALRSIECAAARPRAA
jgi:hypothetical protein